MYTQKINVTNMKQVFLPHYIYYISLSNLLFKRLGEANDGVKIFLIFFPTV